ncbi:MAG TPA: hypothetical protein VHN74_13790 [Candidatus Angelobacter sp.]|jgi:hypothetical protein|nr:hypothetical protein [Candidatus Angelobacter sp.]
MSRNRFDKDERSPERREDDQARLDELGDDPGQVGLTSGGQSGSTQRLSEVEDASQESVEKLAETGQDLEASAIDGVEDAADHPERPVHTHQEYGHPDDLPPNRQREDSGEPEDEAA